MNINFDSDKPIFLQICTGIEDAILSGAFREESQIPSITEFSVTYRINPATALKGINILVDKNIVYKKRGVGMFVSTGAVNKLLKERQNNFYEEYVRKIVYEAKQLGITSAELSKMIERGYGDE